MTLNPNLTGVTVALTRHGQTNWNAAGRLQGSTDVPLNDVGRGQAAASAARFAGGSWDCVVTSPLSRASETGRIIADALGVDVGGVYPDLSERHYGDAEGMTIAEAAELWPDGEYPGVEARTSVASRALSALSGIATELPGSAVIVVAHGTLIREVLRRITTAEIPPIENAATSVLELRYGSWRAVTVNDRSFAYA